MSGEPIIFADLNEAFGLICEGLAAQGWKQARNPGPLGKCRYRTNNGLKCAVGQLIPDEVYDMGMEGETVHDFCDSGLFKFAGGPPDVGTHLARLQFAHDNSHGPLDMQRLFRQYAADNGLTFPAHLVAPEISTETI